MFGTTASWRLSLLAAGLWVSGLAGPMAAHAADRVHKCVVQGRTIYQRDNCPVATPRQQPSVAELNAERRRRMAQEKAGSIAEPDVPTAPAPAASGSGVAEAPPPLSRAMPWDRKATMAPLGSSYRCDGRKYCSQMHSCDEARYFLSHCPDVKMDGDRDGVPCEAQWCH